MTFPGFPGLYQPCSNKNKVPAHVYQCHTEASRLQTNTEAVDEASTVSFEKLVGRVRRFCPDTSDLTRLIWYTGDKLINVFTLQLRQERAKEEKAAEDTNLEPGGNQSEVEPMLKWSEM